MASNWKPKLHIITNYH